MWRSGQGLAVWCRSRGTWIGRILAGSSASPPALTGGIFRSHVCLTLTVRLGIWNHVPFSSTVRSSTQLTQNAGERGEWERCLD